MDQQLKQLMKELGEAINESLADSEQIAEVVSKIKDSGYDIFLVLEATIGVSKPGEKSENPGIELSPEAIRRVMDDDPATLVTLAHALHDAGMKAMAAIDAKNADALSDAGEAIDNACENCHLKYWYPPDAEKIEGAGSVRKK